MTYVGIKPGFPPATNEDLLWLLDESAAPFASTGADAASLSITGSVSALGQGVQIANTAAQLTTADTSDGEAATDITIHGWLR